MERVKGLGHNIIGDIIKRIRNPDSERQPQQVVRSIVVSLASPEEIYDVLKRQTPVGFLRFYLGVKGKKEGYRYTLLGGNIKSDEEFNEAIQREIDEEANIVGLGIPWQTIIGKWRYSSKKSGDREVTLTYNPVLPNGEIKAGEGLTGIVSLNIDQFEELVNNGVLNDIPFEAHLSTAKKPKDKIKISEEDRKKRDEALKKGMGWMRHIENYLKKRFRSIIENNPGLSEEEFTIEYQKILSEFMRKGLTVGLKREETIESKEEASEKLKKALNSGFLGKDILYYLPYLAEYGLNCKGLDNATEGVKAFTGFLKGVFGEFLSKKGLSEEDYFETLKGDNVRLEDKKILIDLLNENFRINLKELFGLTDEDLDKAQNVIQNFFRELSNEMKVADPQLTSGLYQDFLLVNEVNNADYGGLLSLFLGYDTKKNFQAEKIIRFEAGRHLLLLLKALVSIQYYEKQIKRIRGGRIELAINNFFGPIVEGTAVYLSNDVNMQIRIREKEGKRYIVDEKPTKTIISFLRKSFEERVENIVDFYGVSIVDKNLKPEEFNLDYYKNFIDNFKSYLEEQYPDFNVETSKVKTYGSKDFIDEKSPGYDGKRSGSQSQRMVRGKVDIKLKDRKNNEVESLELTIYPFFSLQDKGYWGWLEKIKDDKSYVVRRLLAGQEGIPSLYDLLFPPSLFPSHYQHRLKSSYND